MSTGANQNYRGTYATVESLPNAAGSPTVYAGLDAGDYAFVTSDAGFYVCTNGTPGSADWLPCANPKNVTITVGILNGGALRKDCNYLDAGFGVELQAALAEARALSLVSNGVTVRVLRGLIRVDFNADLAFNFLVSKKVHLSGEGVDATVLEMMCNCNAIHMDIDGAQLSDLTIRVPNVIKQNPPSVDKSFISVSSLEELGGVNTVSPFAIRRVKFQMESDGFFPGQNIPPDFGDYPVYVISVLPTNSLDVMVGCSYGNVIEDVHIEAINAYLSPIPAPAYFNAGTGIYLHSFREVRAPEFFVDVKNCSVTNFVNGFVTDNVAARFTGCLYDGRAMGDWGTPPDTQLGFQLNDFTFGAMVRDCIAMPGVLAAVCFNVESTSNGFQTLQRGYLDSCVAEYDVVAEPVGSTGFRLAGTPTLQILGIRLVNCMAIACTTGFEANADVNNGSISACSAASCFAATSDNSLNAMFTGVTSY